jgi:hypothetical protein
VYLAYTRFQFLDSRVAVRQDNLIAVTVRDRGRMDSTNGVSLRCNESVAAGRRPLVEA